MRVYGWMRTGATGGAYPIPTSEASYLAHKSSMCGVITSYGAILQSDGSWLRGVGGAFAMSLRGVACAAGQEYWVSVSYANREDLYGVLDNPACWDTSAAALVDLIMSEFDSPWFGVAYSPEGQSAAYKALHGQYLQVLSTAVRAMGTPFLVDCLLDVEGYALDNLDLNDIASAADIYMPYPYTWAQETSKCISPYWWAKAGLDHAIEHGITVGRMIIGFPLFANYYPGVESMDRYEITYPQAMTIIEDGGGIIEWIESDAFGLVREKRAFVGPGVVWFHDADTFQERLALVDEYNLFGVMIFAPGMEDPLMWQLLAEWEQRAERDIDDPIPIHYGPQCCPVLRTRLCT